MIRHAVHRTPLGQVAGACAACVLDALLRERLDRFLSVSFVPVANLSHGMSHLLMSMLRAPVCVRYARERMSRGCEAASMQDARDRTPRGYV